MKKTFLVAALALSLTALHAAEAPAAPQAPMKFASGAHIVVSGANAAKAEPTKVGLAGKPLTEVSFEVMADAVKKHPDWKVTTLSKQPVLSTLHLRSATEAKTKLQMQLSTDLADHLQLKAGDEVSAVVRRSNTAGVVIFSKGETPLGFMADDGLQVKSKN